MGNERPGFGVDQSAHAEQSQGRSRGYCRKPCG